jgi:D-alanyl-D-alanine carboxypeptidase (penicillin-binding protein 5/6)
VEPSAIGFRPGESYTRRELLYALMLKSANDVAQALARDNAGSLEAFAEKMTRRAASLGAENSHFANPHGLPNPNHYTTPHDLALIARAAMQQPVFRQIVGTVDHPWITAQGLAFQLKNHNKLLWCPPWKFEGCTGLKTGYTVKAQQVLVSAALRNHREVISVVMHSDKPGIWVDSKTLLTYGLSHLPESPRFD